MVRNKRYGCVSEDMLSPGKCRVERERERKKERKKERKRERERERKKEREKLRDKREGEKERVTVGRVMVVLRRYDVGKQL